MYDLNNIIITELDPPMLVHSRKGETFKMTDRPSYGLSFCITGQITYVMDHIKYISKPGTAVILPKGASYTLFRDKEGQFPLFNFDCQYYHCPEIQIIDLSNPKACLQKFDTIQKMVLHGKSHLQILSAFYDLLSSICEDSLPFSPLLQTALQYMNENLAIPDLSNQSIAAQLSISEVYLRKLFHQHYQTSPRQYLLKQRMQKAMYLLINTTLSITEISVECGFTNLYHFCRTFKQRTGLTPTEYAIKNRFYEI